MELNPFKQKSSIKQLKNGLTEQNIKDRGYLSFALECIDNLIENGTDRYGREHHDMLVSILDVRTKNCPEFPPRTTCRIGGNIGYIPTPYMVNLYNKRDFSWGYYGAYVWQDIDIKPTANNGLLEYSFDSVNAKAIAIRIKIDKELPCAIYEIVVNKGAVKPSKAAATYSIEGAWSSNSIYSEGFMPENAGRNYVFVNNVAALIDGRYPQKNNDDTDIPVFSFLERETDYTKDSYTDGNGREGNIPPKINKKTGSDEWIMLEFEEETAIDNIMISLELENGYTMPESIEVAWTNELDYSKAKYPDYMVVPWRGEKRECYWNPRGSEFYEDQSMMHSMESATNITGDSKYVEFIEKYFNEVLKISNGSEEFMWGTHKFYDVFYDECKSPNGDPHEMAIKTPVWELFWQFNSEATTSEIEYIRKMHIVDYETGEYNRHDVGNPQNDNSIKKEPCCISIAGGQFVYAFSFLYTKTNDIKYLDAAKLIANMHYNARGEKTGLSPDVPSKGDGFPSHYCGTEIIGTFCYGLLKSYETTGDELFKDQALQYLRNFGKYAYDEDNERFYAMVNIHTGETISGARWNSGEKPLGYVDLWQPYQYGFEQPLIAAQSYAYAYYLTGDEDMLYYAEKWAFMISNNPPEIGCRFDTRYELYARLFSRQGTFADYYGRSISMFLNLYVTTKDNKYLAKAKEFANEAILKLYYNGLFRGHPVRNYYSNVDGVGFLVYSLLQLHVLENNSDIDFSKLVDIDNF